MTRPEQTELRLGFIPLADAAPLIVAKAQGLFEAEGLDVTLAREPSWANIRDKVQAGLLDGAHMLGPMALASSLGAGGPAAAMIAPLALNSGGSAITVSMALASAMRAADPKRAADRSMAPGALTQVVEQRRAAGAPPLVFAAVFPFSMHAYELRAWMAAAAVDPDRDVRLVFIAPPKMCARLRSGEIDGFCVGAPWSELAVSDGDGIILLHGSAFWPTGPDKVLGLLASWAETRPATVTALLRALIRAQLWADAPENRPALAALLARPDHVGAPAAVIARALEVSGLAFNRWAAGFPWLSHAAWFLTQMVRWGQIGPETDVAAAARAVYRPDLYRAAAAEAGVSAPTADAKIEGDHAGAWRLDARPAPIDMPSDRLFDGGPFVPPGLLARI